MRATLLVSFALALALLRAPRAAADPVNEPAPALSQEPWLRIEVGSHSGALSGLFATSVGTSIITTALDNTLRVWDGGSLALLQVVRLPGGPAAGSALPLEEGLSAALEAAALAPGGESCAVATSAYGGSIYLVPLKGPAERLLRRLAPDPPRAARVSALAFSPDGRRLAVGLREGGVRVLALADGAELARDADYAGAVVDLHFSPQGHLAVSGADAQVRLYEPGGGLRSRLAPPSEAARPHGLRFSPDGARLAIGHLGASLVRVVTAAELSPLAAPQLPGARGDLRVVVWSRHGDTLFAAGAGAAGGGQLASVDQGGLGRFTERGAAPAVLTHLAALPLGVALGGGTSFGVLRERDAHPRLHLGPAERSLSGLRLHPGGQVSFTLPDGEPGLFVPAEQTLLVGPEVAPRPPPAAPSGLRLTIHGAALRLHEAGAPRWQVSTASAVREAALAADGRTVAALLTDGTLRWYASTDGRELLAFYLHLLDRAAGEGQRPEERWVAWTPTGLFNAGGGGAALLGWQRERDEEHPADFFRASLLQQHLRRPDVLSRILTTQDERRALNEANAEAERAGSTLPVDRLLPPVVTLLEPAEGTLVAGARLAVRVRLRSPSGERITAVRALVRGQSSAARGVVVTSTPSRPGPRAPAEAAVEHTLSIDVPGEEGVLQVTAETEHTRSEAESARLRYGGPRLPAAQARPELRVLAIGISDYRDPRLRLHYAAKDASDMSAALRAQAGRLYRGVEVRLLVNSQAQAEAVREGLRWLRDHSSPDTVALVFIAGHGVNDPSSGSYFFLPHEADLRQRATLLSGDELQRGLTAIPGKVLLFLDTCHSGNLRTRLRRFAPADLSALTSDLTNQDNGVVVFAASSAGQTSQESPRWGNGAFTKAAVEGLRGRADVAGRGLVTQSMLETYISQRVRELTLDAQTPTTAKPNNLADFLVARHPYPLHRKWWLWTTAGLALGAVVTGVVLDRVLNQPERLVLRF